MAHLTRRIRVFSDGSLEVLPQLWRVNHDRTPWRIGLPEVNPFLDNHFTEMTRDIQLLSKAINPLMSKEKWRSVYTYQRAFTNGQGFDEPGDQRADWVNERSTTLENPKQEALCCGGTILAQKYIANDYLYCEYIDGTKPIPSFSYVAARPWLWFDAVNIDQDSSGNLVIRRFPQGLPDRTHILLLASRPIKIHLSKVTKLVYGSTPPSPYVIP